MADFPEVDKVDKLFLYPIYISIMVVKRIVEACGWRKAGNGRKQINLPPSSTRVRKR